MKTKDKVKKVAKSEFVENFKSVNERLLIALEQLYIRTDEPEIRKEILDAIRRATNIREQSKKAFQELEDTN